MDIRFGQRDGICIHGILVSKCCGGKAKPVIPFLSSQFVRPSLGRNPINLRVDYGLLPGIRVVIQYAEFPLIDDGRKALNVHPRKGFQLVPRRLPARPDQNLVCDYHLQHLFERTRALGITARAKKPGCRFLRFKAIPPSLSSDRSLVPFPLLYRGKGRRKQASTAL